MPVPTRIPQEKNIWVAAGDGDLNRVQVRAVRYAIPLLASISPNAPDAFTYTPMHAAASYGQLPVLSYLVSQGGDVNVIDEDGDTPLYTVENVETAQWLISHGAAIDRRNNEGVSPADHLEEDFPDVAAFLRSQLAGHPVVPSEIPISQPSQHQQDAASETLTLALMQSVQDIMRWAETDDTDPDEELRQAVSRAVLEGVLAGYEMSNQQGQSEQDSESFKRPRTEGDSDHGGGGAAAGTA
ncbi:ankyrin repeat-containing domain protein [Pisolithus croceorrhizus]|nr:ankyrin repeat-containing domain protein [Pisolithus croceorrhizus]